MTKRTMLTSLTIHDPCCSFLSLAISKSLGIRSGLTFPRCPSVGESIQVVQRLNRCCELYPHRKVFQGWENDEGREKYSFRRDRRGMSGIRFWMAGNDGSWFAADAIELAHYPDPPRIVHTVSKSQHTNLILFGFFSLPLAVLQRSIPVGLTVRGCTPASCFDVIYARYIPKVWLFSRESNVTYVATWREKTIFENISFLEPPLSQSSLSILLGIISLHINAFV